MATRNVCPFAADSEAFERLAHDGAALGLGFLELLVRDRIALHAHLTAHEIGERVLSRQVFDVDDLCEHIGVAGGEQVLQVGQLLEHVDVGAHDGDGTVQVDQPLHVEEHLLRQFGAVGDQPVHRLPHLEPERFR
jgi:hypothetical protein